MVQSMRISCSARSTIEPGFCARTASSFSMMGSTVWAALRAVAASASSSETTDIASSSAVGGCGGGGGGGATSTSVATSDIPNNQSGGLFPLVAMTSAMKNARYTVTCVGIS